MADTKNKAQVNVLLSRFLAVTEATLSPVARKHPSSAENLIHDAVQVVERLRRLLTKLGHELVAKRSQ